MITYLSCLWLFAFIGGGVMKYGEERVADWEWYKMVMVK